jgi:hypothetical protein
MDDDFDKTAYTKKIGSKDVIYVNPETGEEIVINIGQKPPSNFIAKAGKRLLSKRHKSIKKRARKLNVIRTVRRKQRK